MRVSNVPWGGEHGHGLRPGGVTAGILHNTYGQYPGDVSTVSQNGSAHFVIGKNEGEWVQLADTDSITWNVGNWDLNQHSVALEFTGTSEEELTPWQVQAGGHIVAEVSAHYGIPLTYDDGSDGPNDVAPWSGWYAHRAVKPDSGSQHSDFLTQSEWASLLGGGDDVTQEQMDTLGRWMKEQKDLLQGVIGQWLKDVEGRINAHVDTKLAELDLPAGGGTVGLGPDDVRAIVREEIDKTKLGV